MWILFELTDTNMVFTLYDDTGTAVSVTGNPFTYSVTSYTYDILDKPEEFVIVRKIDDGRKLGGWPPVGAFPKANMVFINSSTGPVETVRPV